MSPHGVPAKDTEPTPAPSCRKGEDPHVLFLTDSQPHPLQHSGPNRAHRLGQMSGLAQSLSRHTGLTSHQLQCDPCGQLRIQAHPRVTPLSQCDGESSGLDAWTDSPSAGGSWPLGFPVRPWRGGTPLPHPLGLNPTQILPTAIVPHSGPARAPAFGVPQQAPHFQPP